MEIFYRPAKLSDIPLLVELAHNLNQFHGEATYPDSESLAKDWDKFEAFVVSTPESVCGFLAGYTVYQFHTATLGFEIQNLFVSASQRKQGLAKGLMKYAIQKKYSEGIRSFKLGVWESNQQARRFYEDCGFVLSQHPNLRYKLTGDKLESFIKSTQK